VLNGSTGSRLKLRVTTSVLAVGKHASIQPWTYLDDGLTILGVLGVDDDLQVHSFFIHHALQSYSVAVREGIVGIWNDKEIQTLEVDPEIVRVENLEFTD